MPTKKTREELRAFFEKGDRPTEEQFADFIESVLNILDDSGDIIYHAELDLSPAEILLLNTTPIEIVPAPTDGKSIIPISAWARSIPGTSEYFTNLSLVLTQDITQQRIFLFSTILSSTVDKTIFGALTTNSSGATTQVVPETSLKVHVQNGNPTNGDNSLKMHVLYMLK